MFTKKLVLFLTSLALAAVHLSCASFIKEEEMPALKKLESPVYVMKRNVKIGSGSVEKGREVKVVIIAGDDWLKVYTYPAARDKLSAPRTLVLYMFDDEFAEEKYSYKVFEKRFFEILETKSGN